MAGARDFALPRMVDVPSLVFFGSVLMDDVRHTPVLVAPVLELLDPRPGEIVVDATLGLAGHALRFISAIGSEGQFVGVDVDALNLEAAGERLSDAPCKVVVVRDNFARIDAVLDGIGLRGVDVLFADLGVSSTQLDVAMRGFSFQQDGPLDMRMDDRSPTTAADLVNRLREAELADLFFNNAQERKSRRIAREICRVRKEDRIMTTGRLSEVVCRALRVHPNSRRSRIHPATRVFQALRMAVNEELSVLDVFLEKAPRVLNAGGRVGVISFHSLEDGKVKWDFRKRQRAGVYEIVTKRPTQADEEERRCNPRSRSAKLRVARRTEVDMDDC